MSITSSSTFRRSLTNCARSRRAKPTRTANPNTPAKPSPRANKKKPRRDLRGLIQIRGLLLQLLQRFLNCIEVWQILGRRRLFGILDDAVFIDDECSAGGSGAEAHQIRQQHAVV